MGSAVPVVLLAAAIGVIILLLVEIRQWRTGRRIISRRRFALRMVGGLLMLGLTSAVFVGLYVLHLTSPSGRPVLFAAFWFGCLAGAFGLMFLAAADMREVEDRQTQREKELWRDFARMLLSRRGKGADKEPPAEQARNEDKK